MKIALHYAYLVVQTTLSVWLRGEPSRQVNLNVKLGVSTVEVNEYRSATDVLKQHFYYFITNITYFWLRIIIFKASCDETMTWEENNKILPVTFLLQNKRLAVRGQHSLANQAWIYEHLCC